MTASVDIGGYNEDYISGEIHYIESYSDNYWAPVGNGIFYDGVVVDTVEAVPSKEDIMYGDYKMAVFDTGTAGMALNKRIMNALYPLWKNAAKR